MQKAFGTADVAVSRQLRSADGDVLQAELATISSGLFSILPEVLLFSGMRSSFRVGFDIVFEADYLARALQATP